MALRVFAIDAELHVGWIDPRRDVAAEARDAANHDSGIVNGDGMFVDKDNGKSCVPLAKTVAEQDVWAYEIEQSQIKGQSNSSEYKSAGSK